MRRALEYCQKMEALTMKNTVSSAELATRVIRGEPAAIARMLSRAESGSVEAREGLGALYRQAGRAHVIGITGVPGSGKSTLVAKLAAAVRRSGRKIAIVAIDPSSPFSGGSILGDRIRMSDLARSFEASDPYFRFDAIVAATAEVLRDSPWTERLDVSTIADIADREASGLPATDEVHDFLDLLGAMAAMQD